MRERGASSCYEQLQSIDPNSGLVSPARERKTRSRTGGDELQSIMSAE